MILFDEDFSDCPHGIAKLTPVIDKIENSKKRKIFLKEIHPKETLFIV
jgi:hypothetical protein